MLIESSSNDVERMESDFLNFVVLFCHTQTGSIFNCVLGEDHTQ